ncbi:MAG: restriction endonuclease subunit S [Pseudomonas sp.]
MSTLGDLTAPKVDQTGPLDDGEFVYVDISSIDNQAKRIVEPKRLPAASAPSRARQRLQQGDVLVSITRPNLNAVAIVPPDLDGAIGSTGFHVLRAKDSVEPHWLYYAVQNRDFVHSMSELVQGALYPAVRPKDIREYSIVPPPLDDQRRIVAEIEKQFSRLDEAVANLQRVKANLKRYKASVLKAAIEGRLVPTEAELARREGRSYEPSEQLLQRILEARRGQWARKGKYCEPDKPSDCLLPQVPEGWSVATVEQLSCLVEYGSSAKTNEDSTGVPVLRMGNIVEGELVFDELKYLPSSHEEFPKLLAEPGDLLFNRTNSPELVGKTAVFKGPKGQYSFASYLIRIRLIVGGIPEFIAAYINSRYGRQWIKSVVTQQVGQANVNGTKLQALAVPLPPLAEQHRIVAEVDRRLSLAREVETEVEANLKRAQALSRAVLSANFAKEKAE